jgi:putative transposase
LPRRGLVDAQRTFGISPNGPIDRSVDANKLVEHLDKVAAVRGWPRYLRCDNGPELISNAIADWAKDRT